MNREKPRATNRALTCLLAVIISSSLVAGCSRNLQVDSQWLTGESRKQTFQRILIVGVSPNINTRCNFEHFLATQVSSETVIAITSCSAMPMSDPLTIEGIDKAVRAKQADAVLASILVASKVGAEVGGDNETRGGAYYKATGTGYASGYYGGYGRYGGYGAYGVPVTYVEFQTAAPIATVDGKVEISSRLFETNERKLVYELLTTAKQLYSSDSAFSTVSIAIADRLRRDGLIR